MFWRHRIAAHQIRIESILDWCITTPFRLTSNLLQHEHPASEVGIAMLAEGWFNDDSSTTASLPRSSFSIYNISFFEMQPATVQETVCFDICSGIEVWTACIWDTSASAEARRKQVDCYGTYRWTRLTVLRHSHSWHHSPRILRSKVKTGSQSSTQWHSYTDILWHQIPVRCCLLRVPPGAELLLFDWI